MEQIGQLEQVHIQQLLLQAKEHRLIAQRYEVEANRIKHRMEEKQKDQIKEQQTECSS